jgi:hypothetical protein
MKHLYKIITILILTAIIISCREKPEDKIVSGVITLIVNKVETTEGSVWKDAKLLEEIGINKVIRTKQKSKAEIFLNDKNRILMQEKTVFIPILLTKRNKKFRFKEGYIFAKVEKLAKQESYTIFTPSVAVGVRGTEFAVISDENSERISVRSGKVKVRFKSKYLEKALKHTNPKIQATARAIKQGIIINDYETVTIDKDKYKSFNAALKLVVNSKTISEKALDNLLALTRLESKPANPADFTWALEYLSKKPASKQGTPVKLDGINKNTEIFVNGKSVATGTYSKVFTPGKYEFKFTLKQYKHSVTKQLTGSAKQTVIIKAPFPEKLPQTKPVRKKQGGAGPYEANPEGRAAN